MRYATCQCGHKRSQHECHPDYHCYLCKCKQFTASWRNGKRNAERRKIVTKSLPSKVGAGSTPVEATNLQQLIGAVENLRLLVIRAARAKTDEKKSELIGHANRISLECGIKPSLLREYTENETNT